MIKYFLITLTEKLMKKYKIPFDQALSAVLASKTYSNLVSDGMLLNEGDLFIFEKLENELEQAQ